MNTRTALSVILFTVFLDLLGFGILIPLLPYVALDFDATGAQVGFLMASYSIMQFLFAPIWGRLSDRVGRRPIILISLVGAMIGYLIFAYAESLTWLFVSRVLSGMAAANISTANAAVADLMPREKRTAGMGMVGAAIGAGFVFGPGLAGLLVGDGDYRLPFLAAAGLSALNLILAYFFLPETLNRAGVSEPSRRFNLQALSSALRIQYIPQLLGVSFLYFVAFAAMESTFALFLHHEFHASARLNAYLLLMVGIIMVVVQGGIVGRLARRWGDRPLLAMGIIGLMGGLVGISQSTTLSLFIIAIALLAVSAGLAGPALTSLISLSAPTGSQGGMLGLHQSMASLGRILGPLLGTQVFERIGPRAPFMCGAVLILLALVVLAPMLFPFRLHASKKSD